MNREASEHCEYFEKREFNDLSRDPNIKPGRETFVSYSGLIT